MNTEIHFDGIILGPIHSGFTSPFNVNVSFSTAAGELRLENANYECTFTHLLRCCSNSPNFQSIYNGSFNLSSPNTGNQFVSAETLTDFFIANHSQNQPTGTTVPVY